MGVIWFDPARLDGVAQSWRTRRQLERLSETPRASSDRFSFAVLGDAEPGRFWVFRKLFNRPGVFRQQVRRIQDEEVDFSIQLGDMVSRGIGRNYQKLFADLDAAQVRLPYLTIIGNHDRRFPHGRADSGLYRRYFGRTNYFFDRGPARFVCLDTSDQRVTPGRLRWLDRVLDTPLRKIVFTHIPPAPLRLWPDFAGAKGVGGFKRGAEELTGLLSRRKVDRVYLGHIHAFGVQDYRGVRYVLSGGGGSPLFPSSAADRFHHYLRVEVAPEGLRETVRCLDGKSFAVPASPVVLARA